MKLLARITLATLAVSPAPLSMALEAFDRARVAEERTRDAASAHHPDPVSAARADGDAVTREVAPGPSPVVGNGTRRGS